MGYTYSRNMIDSNNIKQYAVVIYIPERLERFVTPLRERFDPDYDLVAAHITLVFPWESSRPASDFAALISDEVAGLPPFTVKLDSVGDFYPESPIIYWRVAPSEELTRLSRGLHARLEQPLPFHRFIPHVTVGKEISPHRVMMVKDQIASYLPGEAFEVKAIDLVSPVADHHWVSVRTFPLTGD